LLLILCLQEIIFLTCVANPLAALLVLSYTFNMLLILMTSFVG